MSVTKSVPEDTDFTVGELDIGVMCGDNAANWAKAFCQIAKANPDLLATDGLDEGWMIGWFANAIECSQDARNGTGPVVLPDGSAFFTGQVG